MSVISRDTFAIVSAIQGHPVGPGYVVSNDTGTIVRAVLGQPIGFGVTISNDANALVKAWQGDRSAQNVSNDTRAIIRALGGDYGAQNVSNDTRAIIDALRANSGPVAPADPSGLTANALDASNIKLEWNSNSGGTETGFRIERKTTGAYAEIATVGTATVQYNDSGLTASTQYFYRVRAYNAGGNSAYSNEANATTQAPTDHVADIAARLSLLGKSVGYQVIQDSDGLTYQYNGFSTAKVGNFVLGTSAADANAVYSNRGTLNGKPYSNVLGQPDDPVTSSISWNGAIWRIFDNAGAIADTGVGGATPDLATWGTATVTAVTTGELVAGLNRDSGGVIYKVSASPINGRNDYTDVLVIVPDLTWNNDPAKLQWTDSVASSAFDDTDSAFPWQADWSGAGITMERDDWAADSNWSVIP